MIVDREKKRKKEKVEAEKRKKEKKEARLGKTKSVKTSKRTKKIKEKEEMHWEVSENSSEDSDHTECILWCENFKRSVNGEGRIQCTTCRGWAHDECAGVGDDEEDYTCTRCVFSSQVAPTKLQIKFCLLIILSQNF
jgi:hypothetical protein